MTVATLLIIIAILLGALLWRPVADTYHLHLIIKKLNKMGQNLDELNAKLDQATAKVTAIAADVQRLHDLISNTTGETPTAAEWQAIKDKADSLNASLQAVDDQTPE